MTRPEPSKPELTVEHLTEFQQQLTQAQTRLTEIEVTGTAGDGAVSVTLSADGRLSAVRIDPRHVELNDIARLERWILAAYADAADGVSGLTQQMMGPLAAMMSRVEQSL